MKPKKQPRKRNKIPEKRIRRKAMTKHTLSRSTHPTRPRTKRKPKGLNQLQNELKRTKETKLKSHSGRKRPRLTTKTTKQKRNSRN
jgi:hypothetical protein